MLMESKEPAEKGRSNAAIDELATGHIIGYSLGLLELPVSSKWNMSTSFFWLGCFCASIHDFMLKSIQKGF